MLNGNSVFENKVNPGDVISLFSGNGVIWYTTDGSDPAVYDPVAGISAMARMYLSPVIITGSAHFKARVLLNGTWSALSEQNFIVPADFKDIKITEVHYHPVNHNEVPTQSSNSLS